MKRQHVILVASTFAVAVIAIWWASPRSYEIPVTESVCEYDPRTFSRVAFVQCGGHVGGVVNRGQSLYVPRKGDGALVALAKAEVGGHLRVEKGFFAQYRFEFVASDGTVTELEETDVYIGGTTNTLE